jgi:L-iditol 2-dehydrogenase
VVIYSRAQTLKDAVLAATDDWGADVAAVTVGSARLVEETLGTLARGGRMNIFAGIYPKEPVSLDPNLIHYRELRVVASSDSTPADFRQALSLIEQGQVQVLPLISHLLPLEQLTEGMEIVKQAQGLKVMIDIHA